MILPQIKLQLLLFTFFQIQYLYYQWMLRSLYCR